MLADISNVDAIYIVCGRTDMRKLLMACTRLLRISFPWSLIIHFIFSVVANATGSKQF